MKRIIKAASTADEEMLKCASDIQKKAQALFDAIDTAPGHVIEKCDLYDLYEVLNEDLPAISFTINELKGKAKPKYDDMW